MERILCVHQGAELYGSDRSFLSAVNGLKKSNQVDVVLPFHGELVDFLEKEPGIILYNKDGILRKKDIKRIFTFLFDTAKGIKYYFKKYKDYDIIYINTVVMLSALVASMFYRFSSKKKIFCHVREIPTGKQLLFFKFLFKIVGVKLIYNSVATCKAFNLPGDVIYNGVSDLNEPLDKEKKHYTSDNVKLLLIGRINTWKGHQLLIDSIINAKEQLKGAMPFQVRIVGSAFEGYEYLLNELKEKVNQNDLQDNITFFDFAKNPAEHFSWADYIVVPSSKPEPFGRVAVEAFAMSRPVIAANHGGLSEILTDKNDGFLFSPNNVRELVSILLFLTNITESDYKTLSINARAKYEKMFSEHKYQNDIIKIILGNK
ncbi:glycosyltransferase family 4 protein [Raoultella ornithinolytica]|uniref:glycosyltransferase family 4 protein n=1 Tax=Raoultella ornithinolytica TaxID=54291 RepID=UPI0038F80A70